MKCPIPFARIVVLKGRLFVEFPTSRLARRCPILNWIVARVSAEVVPVFTPRLRLVCFNGKTAGEAQDRIRVLGYKTCVLPSSSGANRRNSTRTHPTLEVNSRLTRTSSRLGFIGVEWRNETQTRIYEVRNRSRNGRTRRGSNPMASRRRQEGFQVCIVWRVSLIR